MMVRRMAQALHTHELRPLHHKSIITIGAIVILLIGIALGRRLELMGNLVTLTFALVFLNMVVLLVTFSLVARLSEDGRRGRKR